MVEAALLFLPTSHYNWAHALAEFYDFRLDSLEQHRSRRKQATFKAGVGECALDALSSIHYQKS
jgi:hypothetical protein